MKTFVLQLAEPVIYELDQIRDNLEATIIWLIKSLALSHILCSFLETLFP